MPSIITDAFPAWNADKIVNNEPAIADRMVFALLPDQDPNAGIAPNESLPSAHQIAYSTRFTRIAKLDENAVVYSVVLDTTVGDWAYNWVGIVDSLTNTVLMITHTETQRKIKTGDGQQGNSLIRNMVMEFSGAAEATQITVTPETWQIDFEDRIHQLEGEIDIQLAEKVDKVDVTQSLGISKEKVVSQALLTESLAEVDGDMRGKVNKAGDEMTGSLGIEGQVTPTNYDNFDEQYARRDKNLSDLTDKKTARTHLNVYATEDAVPAIRTVNKKSLDNDIELTAKDTGSVPDTRTINKKKLSDDITLTAADVNAVPTTRKINGEPLDKDITITAEKLLAITGIRAGAATSYSERGNKEHPPGFMTSWADYGQSDYAIKVRPIQYLIDGTWYTASFL